MHVGIDAEGVVDGGGEVFRPDRLIGGVGGVLVGAAVANAGSSIGFSSLLFFSHWLDHFLIPACGLRKLVPLACFGSSFKISFLYRGDEPDRRISISPPDGKPPR